MRDEFLLYIPQRHKVERVILITTFLVYINYISSIKNSISPTIALEMFNSEQVSYKAGRGPRPAHNAVHSFISLTPNKRG